MFGYTINMAPHIFNEKFERVITLTSDATKDRIPYIKRIYKENNIKSEFYFSVDPKILKEHRITPGGISCTSGHYGIISTAIIDEVDSILILEDDVVLCDNHLQLLDDFFNKINNNKTLNLIVSKSGNTLETIANLSTFFSRTLLKDKLIFKVVMSIISVWFFGSLLISYIEEGSFEDFSNSLWWTIVTMTTVGYGDIAPVTPFGQFIASIIMILGYAVIAVPTGIVSSEMTKDHKNIHLNTQSCSHCSASDHKDNAEFCYDCGEKLN